MRVGVLILSAGDRRIYRLDDVDVSGAATEISGNSALDIVFAYSAVLEHEPIGRHEHAGRAVAALYGIRFQERLLQRMQLCVGCKPFNRYDTLVFNCGNRHRAGPHRLVVHNHGARAALAFAATVLRSRQTKVISQDP